ncbi:MAG: hypothetical protein M0R17_04705 [Candidatus Omnitrophica bacterium]|jgi:hypothetical protein|nr:hypothetical protein [Candidatus Omnitrophota bacterium]
MEYTIDDLLNMLQCPNDNGEVDNKLSPREIWDMVANKESYEKMGFASEQDLKTYLEENPYSDL